MNTLPASDLSGERLRDWSLPDGPDASQSRCHGGLLSCNSFAARSKRGLDVIAAVVIGLLALPVIALIALVIKFSSPGPVFFRQARVGFGGREFQMVKFRSMIVSADATLHDYLSAQPELHTQWQDRQKLKDDPRTTTVGRVLRKLSLDELPQLWNVLLGDMSLIGPRPITPGEVVRYGSLLEIYQRVRPGITGLWQVSGRNDTTYPQRVQLDTRYVRTRTLALDVSILLRTVWAVLSAKGAY